MKPCSKNRKKIAWLALEALDTAQERELRAHLESCPACRAYWREMSALTGKLSAAQMPVELEASERFHQQVVRAVQDEGRGSIYRRLTPWPSFAWRVALPVLGIGAAIAVFSLILRHSEAPQLPTAAPRLKAAFPSEFEPTVARYQMVANESLDRLDELLANEGNRNPPPGPRYAGSALADANSWE
jgi:anti-sigma factor RsiW